MQPASLSPALHSRLRGPALPVQGVRWGGSGGRVDTVNTQALILDLVFHRLEDGLLPHVPRTRSAASRGLTESSSFRMNH